MNILKISRDFYSYLKYIFYILLFITIFTTNKYAPDYLDELNIIIKLFIKHSIRYYSIIIFFVIFTTRVVTYCRCIIPNLTHTISMCIVLLQRLIILSYYIVLPLVFRLSNQMR